MPRRPRVVVPDFPHHVTQRGNRNQRVFFNSRDKDIYLNILREEIVAYGIQIWAYSLMDNHVHLVATPEAEVSLSKGLREVHKRYALMINKRMGWKGHLWQDRYASFVMDEPYLYAAMRYVEQNPVKAGMVKKAAEYTWSSARAHIYKTKDLVLSPCYLSEEIRDWSKYLEKEDFYGADYSEHSKTGKPLGSQKFIQQISKNKSEISMETKTNVMEKLVNVT